MTKTATETFILLFLLLPLFSAAQQSAEVSHYLHKADSLREYAHYEESVESFQKAAELQLKAEDQEGYINSLYKISLNKLDLGEQEEAETFIDDAFSYHQNHSVESHRFLVKYHTMKGRVAEARAEYESALKWYHLGIKKAERWDDFPELKVGLIVNIGDVKIDMGEYEEADKQLTLANETYHQNQLDDKKLLSRIYNSYGNLYQKQGKWEKALEFHQQSLAIDQKVSPPSHPSLAKSNNNIAIVYYYDSDYQRALEHMQNAVSTLTKFYGENHRLVAAGYNNLGVVASEMGDLEKSTQYLKRSLEIKKQVLGADHPEVAIGYGNLGATYYDMGDYDQAIKNYKKAETLNRKIFPGGHPELANVYANLGQAYAGKGFYAKALEYYHKDLNINLNILNDKHPFIGDTYTKIGEAYAQEKSYEMALTYYQRALSIFVEDFNPKEGFQNPPLDKVVYPEMLLQTLELKGDALKKLAEANNKQLTLNRSLQAYLQSVELIDNLQNSYSREGSKFLLRERTADLYKKGVETAFTLYEQTGYTSYKEYAYFFAEKSRNQILLKHIQQLNARQLANLPEALIRRETTLRSQISDLQQKLSSVSKSPEQTDTLKRTALRDSLFHLKKQLDGFLTKLEQSYPKYHRLKYQQVVKKAAEIQEEFLTPDLTILSYFFGNEALYAFTISKDSFDIHRLDARELKDQVNDFRMMIPKSVPDSTFGTISHQLYKRLLAPVSDHLKGSKLLIIPDGPLHYLPFESLVHRLTNIDRFKDLNYLIKKFAISYAPSATYLELRDDISSSQNSKQLAGFAPGFKNPTRSDLRKVYPDYKRPITSLPLSKQEVKQLGDLFNESAGFWSFLSASEKKADIFTESAATEDTFKKLSLEEYRYIHLATHAYVLEEDPNNSGILFAPTDTDDTEDGTLHASEIYNLQLNAELVTLSACNSGIGTIARGEGMMSLSRAFQYAGAKNLLVSLWSVDDRSTAKLMVDFYKRTKQQTTMPTALQKAKLNLIQNGKYAHPKYWAPFIFVGH